MAALRSGEPLIRLLAGMPYPLRQHALAAAYSMVPRRLPNLLPSLAVVLRDLPRTGRALLPDPARAMARPDGLCGLAGRLDVPALLEGYRRGMFVMSHTGPLKWWAPRHRMVLFFDEARVEKGTRRLLRNGRFTFTADAAFAEVMAACAAPREGYSGLTWITPKIRRLFERAHAAGFAHSLEVWQEGELVGGIYGLTVGDVFFTESQFHRARDASKVGFAVLNRHLQAWGFALNDGKHATRYLADSGMQPVTRAEFSALTMEHGAAPRAAGPWHLDPALLGDDWEPAAAPGRRRAELMPRASECAFSVEELLTTARSNTW
jgi:leucyl/phenylalanyl-tRNA--protein transferase